MTDLTYYAGLLDNPTRLEAFRRGIEETVRPGHRVLEVGTGVGTYAFFAARAGAAHVWAVDRDPAIHVAETLAVGNELADRITFVRGSVPEVALPAPFDVVIFEDFAIPLLDPPTWELLRGIRDGYAGPDGVMLPTGARLHLALVHAAAVETALFPLDGRWHDWLGLDWTALRPFLANTPRSMQLAPESLVGAGVAGPRIDLQRPPPPPELTVAGEWRADSPGTVGALALWFDLEVSPGNWISNAPRMPTEPWGQWILPVDPPLQVAAGVTVEARVFREELPGGRPGWMAWSVHAGGERRRGHEFAGIPAGLPDLGEAGSATRED